MQLTLEFEILGLKEADKARFDDLMVRYCSAKRMAYNILAEEEKGVIDVTHILESFPSLCLNWRYCEHAARDASATIRSQRELLPLHLSDVYDKIEEAERKLRRLKERDASRTKIFAIDARLSRLNKRRKILEDHVARGTIPKVIFGSRRLFVAREEGKATNEQWRDARNNQIYSIGQADEKGNANIRLSSAGDKIGINFPITVETKVTKRGTVRVKSERRWFDLLIPPAFRKWLSFLLASGSAYSVRVVRGKGGRYSAMVSFEIHNTPMKEAPDWVLSIDSNPHGFAAAVVSRDGNLLAHRFFRDDRLIYALENKRDCIIGELVSKIVSYARLKGAGAIVAEDLRITRHNNFGRRVNRVVYAFVRRKFFENLLTRAWKAGVPVFIVNPAYTSKLGNTKYREKYGLSIHEAAALCIARRFCGHGEKLKEPMLVRVRKDLRKEESRVKYVWPSLYGYHCPSDPYMEPPGRKGSREARTGGGNGAVFTGRPASVMTPLTRQGDEGVRKGGERGGNPRATDNGGEPAPPILGGGKVSAASEHISG